jgi:hypothetical protein
MSELSIGQLRGLPINNNTVIVPAPHTLYAPGHVIQAVSKTSTTPYSIGITGHTGWSTFPASALELSITPKSLNSRLLLMADVTLGGTSSNNAAFRFIRNGNPIAVGATVESRASVTSFSGWANGADQNHVSRTVSGSFLDSPNTTSAVVYNIQGVTESSSLLWNRQSGYANSNSMFNASAVSTFTVMEIAQ